MLGKLGNLLNKDVGSLVKDAGKVLNTDVGSIVKNTGKVLNADLGDLLRADAVKPASEDATAKAGTYPVAPEPAPDVALGATSAAPSGPPQVAAARITAVAKSFDPDATLQLNTPPLAAPVSAQTTTLPPGMSIAPDPVPAPIMNDETVTRSRRNMPKGTSLTTLLPYEVGEFGRPHAMPSGDLTSDPVTTIYGAGGETVVVKLVLCWDADEARERLVEIRAQAAENFRVAADQSWILGQTGQGMVFAWTRDSYSFSATAPKGIASLTRFLWAFPY